MRYGPGILLALGDGLEVQAEAMVMEDATSDVAPGVRGHVRDEGLVDLDEVPGNFLGELSDEQLVPKSSGERVSSTAFNVGPPGVRSVCALPSGRLYYTQATAEDQRT
jgi:hypothetical protein